MKYIIYSHDPRLILCEKHKREYMAALPGRVRGEALRSTFEFAGSDPCSRCAEEKAERRDDG